MQSIQICTIHQISCDCPCPSCTIKMCAVCIIEHIRQSHSNLAQKITSDVQQQLLRFCKAEALPAVQRMLAELKMKERAAVDRIERELVPINKIVHEKEELLAWKRKKIAMISKLVLEQVKRVSKEEIKVNTICAQGVFGMVERCRAGVARRCAEARANSATVIKDTSDYQQAIKEIKDAIAEIGKIGISSEIKKACDELERGLWQMKSAVEGFGMGVIEGLDEYKEMVQKWRNVEDKMREKIMELERTLETEKENGKKQQKKSEELQVTLQTKLEQAMTTITVKKKEYEQELLNFNTQLKGLESENATYKREIQELNGSLAVVRKDMIGVSEQLKIEKGQHDRDVKNSKAELEKKQAEVEKTINELKECEEKCKKFNNDMTNLQNEIVIMRKNIATRITKIDGVRQQGLLWRRDQLAKLRENVEATMQSTMISELKRCAYGLRYLQKVPPRVHPEASERPLRQVKDNGKHCHVP